MSVGIFYGELPGRAVARVVETLAVSASKSGGDIDVRIHSRTPVGRTETQLERRRTKLYATATWFLHAALRCRGRDPQPVSGAITSTTLRDSSTDQIAPEARGSWDSMCRVMLLRICRGHLLGDAAVANLQSGFVLLWPRSG